MMLGNLPTTTATDELLNQSLHRPVQEFIEARGKRLRGSLVALSHSIAGGYGPLPKEITQSIEWLHAGSLVIDDVQDSSTMRRGRPTMHHQIGVPLAINAGNYMYFRALEFITESTLPAEVRCSVTSEMVRVSRICHEGQAIDLAARVDQLVAKDWIEIAQAIAIRKTGMLVELAMRMGAVAAFSDRHLTEELGKVGSQVGIALQMRNDMDELAEVASSARANAEVVRVDDLRNRRVTWPWAWLTKCCEPAVCEEFAVRLRSASRQKSHAGLGRIAQELLLLVREVGEQEIVRQIEEPIRLLGEHVLDPTALKSLRDCLRPIEYGTLLVTASTVQAVEVST